MQRFDPTIVGQRIREIRQSRGIKAKDLAEKLFMDPSVLGRTEKGEGLGQLDKLLLIADVLGLDVRELIEAGLSGSHGEYATAEDG